MLNGPLYETVWRILRPEAKKLRAEKRCQPAFPKPYSHINKMYQGSNMNLLPMLETKTEPSSLRDRMSFNWT